MGLLLQEKKKNTKRGSSVEPITYFELSAERLRLKLH